MLETRAELTQFYALMNSPIGHSLRSMAEELPQSCPAHSKWEDKIDPKKLDRIKKSFRGISQERIDQSLEAGWAKMIKLVLDGQAAVDKLQAMLTAERGTLVLEEFYAQLLEGFAARKAIFAKLKERV